MSSMVRNESFSSIKWLRKRVVNNINKESVYDVLLDLANVFSQCPSYRKSITGFK